MENLRDSGSNHGHSTDSHGNKLEGKVAIVTGGASGIGEATVRLFSDQGSRMVVIADIQDELGLQLVHSIGSHRCKYVRCDVTDEDQVRNLVESTVNEHGQLDILFSNAGIRNSADQTVFDLDFSLFDQLFSVNVKGMAACVKHAARKMVEQRVRGSIVCTASVVATHGANRGTDYCMSKHAVLGLVRSASLQLADHGIRVNCVSPNGIATPMTCKVLGVGMEEVEERAVKLSRLKGVRLQTEDIAKAVLFLACEDSRFVTGHDLVVDGLYVSH